ncbi:MAG: peptidoglycan DD-metalloendopeptidase family protein [Clostridia bacterium]|nr:peptidoglycan DD-metalloendopeptidase family protein [Clostridia bacterium]
MTNLPITGAFRVTAIYGQSGAYWANGHKGIDLVADRLTVYSTCIGRVRNVGYDAKGWGQFVSIEEPNGRRHIFCHLKKDSVRVKKGAAVDRTTVLGIMGATGNVTGVHLHYQLQQGDTVIDPTLHLGIPNRKGSYHSKNYQIKEAEAMIFKDQKKIPQWAKEAVEEVSEKGLMIGDDNGNFRPDDPITRAEMAVILSRL